MKIINKSGLLAFTWSAPAVLILAVSGCSDNDSIVSSGTAIDGYLQSATVCVDLNANKQCDSNEPRNNTDSMGKYSVATLTSAPLVVDVIPGLTMDSPVQGVAGEVLTEDFFLTAPISATTITPLTTLVQVGVEQGIYSDFSAGAASVASALNVPSGTDITKFDYISAGNARVAVAASLVTQALTDAISNIQNNVQGDVVTTENVFETAVKVLIDPNLAGGVNTSLMQEIGTAVAVAVPEDANLSDIDQDVVVGSVESTIASDSSITSADEVDAATLEEAVIATDSGNNGATGASN